MSRIDPPKPIYSELDQHDLRISFELEYVTIRNQRIMARAHRAEGRAEMTPKEELFNVAIELFSRKGFHGTSIRDIANGRGVSVSNVYLHFKNKEDLWIAIREQAVRTLLDAWERRIAADAGPLDRFRELVTTHFEFYTARQNEARIGVSFAHELSNRGTAKMKSLQRLVLDKYVQHLEELRKAGLVSDEKDTKVIAFSVLGVLNAYVGWYRPNGPISAEEIRKQVIEFICAGTVASADGKPRTCI